MHEAAVELHRQQQLARHHVPLGGAPDLATHHLAGSKLLLRANEPDLDTREIRRSRHVRRHAPHGSAIIEPGRYALLTGPGALPASVIEHQRRPRLRIWIPDVLPGKVRVPGGGHELEQAAGAAGAIDGQRVVVAFAVRYP